MVFEYADVDKKDINKYDFNQVKKLYLHKKIKIIDELINTMNIGNSITTQNLLRVLLLFFLNQWSWRYWSANKYASCVCCGSNHINNYYLFTCDKNYLRILFLYIDVL